MILCDTHTHIYLSEFNSDRDEMVKRAIAAGVKYMFIPHVDSDTTEEFHELCDTYPKNCFPMMGLHPTSVKRKYQEELTLIEENLKSRKYYAIGEVGIDLYWDTSYKKQQEEVFARHIELAIEYDLPLVIHTRNSLEVAIEIVKGFNSDKLRGIFHCFPGNEEQAEEVAGIGFHVGIGGVVSYKNSLMARVVEALPLEHMVLETDAPYLAPVPMRGTRNEPSYIVNIAEKVASIKHTTPSKVAKQTTLNALNIFNITQ